MSEFNENIVTEFRANEGNVSGVFAGAPMILVTHTGAKSGVERTTPLVYSRDGDRYYVSSDWGNGFCLPQQVSRAQAERCLAHVNAPADVVSAILACGADHTHLSDRS